MTDEILASIVLFILIPLVLGIVVRAWRGRGEP